MDLVTYRGGGPLVLSRLISALENTRNIILDIKPMLKGLKLPQEMRSLESPFEAKSDSL